jgi:hypothetical protein
MEILNFNKTEDVTNMNLPLFQKIFTTLENLALVIVIKNKVPIWLIGIVLKAIANASMLPKSAIVLQLALQKKIMKYGQSLKTSKKHIMILVLHSMAILFQ